MVPFAPHRRTASASASACVMSFIGFRATPDRKRAARAAWEFATVAEYHRSWRDVRVERAQSTWTSFPPTPQ